MADDEEVGYYPETEPLPGCHCRGSAPTDPPVCSLWCRGCSGDVAVPARFGYRVRMVGINAQAARSPASDNAHRGGVSTRWAIGFQWWRGTVSVTNTPPPVFRPVGDTPPLRSLCWATQPAGVAMAAFFGALDAGAAAMKARRVRGCGSDPGRYHIGSGNPRRPRLARRTGDIAWTFCTAPWLWLFP